MLEEEDDGALELVDALWVWLQIEDVKKYVEVGVDIRIPTESILRAPHITPQSMLCAHPLPAPSVPALTHSLTHFCTWNVLLFIPPATQR